MRSTRRWSPACARALLSHRHDYNWVINVNRDVLGSDRIQRLRDLPLHQKLVMCALYCARVHDREVSANDVQKYYQAACASGKMTPVSDGFFELVAALSCAGFVSTSSSTKGEKRDTKVCKMAAMRIRW